jgi:hypothetical protein
MGEKEEHLGYQQSRSRNFPHCAQTAPDDCKPNGDTEKEHPIIKIKRRAKFNYSTTYS